MPADAGGLAAALAARRNDLTEAALGLVPEIAAVLDRLAGLPGALLGADERQRRDLLRAVRRPRRRARPPVARSPAGRARWWTAAGAMLTAAPSLEQIADGSAPLIPGRSHISA